MSAGTLQEDLHHLRTLRVACVASWVVSVLVVQVASTLPLFDSSPRVLLGNSNSNWLGHTVDSLLRWDAFHFAHIAQHGYTYEYEWAFFPGAPLLMRTFGNTLAYFGVLPPSSWESVLLGGSVAVCLCGTTTTLYRLTLRHTRSPSFAFLTALLSLLPSSPATLRLTSSTEPFFTYFSYQGMLYCARSQWCLATISFALAGLFRSNGFMLSGFIIWGMLVEPFLLRQKVTYLRLCCTILLTALIFLPFVSLQYAAYRAFCQGVMIPAPWCARMPPLIYSYVQDKYWNVGFLRYWTPQQLPNFLISAPVLALLLYSSMHYIKTALILRLYLFLFPARPFPSIKAAQSTGEGKGPEHGSAPGPTTHSPFLAPSLAPHALHALLFTLTLLLAAHTQIVLRVAASMPFTYWAAARLLVERPKWGTHWVTWSVVWGLVSCVLWATFLPPA